MRVDSYTKEEISILEGYIRTGIRRLSDIEEIQLRLPNKRSKSSIYNKIWKIRNQVKCNKFWTEDEERILYEVPSNLSRGELKRIYHKLQPNRTMRAIYSKRHSHGD